MNLLLRCLWVLLQSYRRPRHHLLTSLKQSYRLWPHDLGWRNHLPNYRVFSFMELGRIGLWHQARLATTGQYSSRIIAAQDYVYIRPVAPLQKFDLETSLIAYDEKYCYYQQQLLVKGRLVGTGLVKEVHMAKGKAVSTAKVLPETVRAQLCQAQHHPIISQWLATQASLKQPQQQKAA